MFKFDYLLPGFVLLESGIYDEVLENTQSLPSLYATLPYLQKNFLKKIESTINIHGN